MTASTDDVPKYQRIAADLKEAIRSGQYAPGDRLPGENKLTEQYGVANMTTRHAMRVLQDEGLAEARKGAGVFVTQAAPAIIEQQAAPAAEPSAHEGDKPNAFEELSRELQTSPVRMAKLAEIREQLAAAVGEAADEVYEVFLGNSADPVKKLIASWAQRNYVERLVSDILNDKAGERGAIFP